jgi:hypothetical protein
MSIPPLSVGEDKLTNAESLSRARAGQVQKYDRWRMGRDERMN